MFWTSRRGQENESVNALLRRLAQSRSPPLISLLSWFRGFWFPPYTIVKGRQHRVGWTSSVVYTLNSFIG